MAKKVTAGKTIFKIACATGGAVLASGVGLPWLGAMAGACLPEVLEGSLGFLVSAVKDDAEKKKVLEELLKKPIEQLASLGIEFTGGRIDDFFKSHFEAKESELNFDLPRAVVKVWEEALNKMLRAERDTSTLGLKRDDEFEKARKELLTFWRQKLRKAESDNDLLKEFFGEKPDYFLDIEKGKASLIDVLPDQKQVEDFFWKRIEESFTNWATIEEKFPEDWANSIHQSLKDELKQNLFHNFSSALKKELKENERAWKSFEFASSLQTVSMLQSLASNIDQIKDDTSNIKNDLVELNTVLPLIMPKIDALEKTAKEYFKSNQTIIKFLNDFRKDINDKLSEIVQTTRRTDETTQRTEAKVVEIGKNVTEIQNQLSKDSFNRFGKASAVSEYEFEKCKKLKWLRKEVSMSESYQLLPMLRTVRTEDLPKEQTHIKEDFSNFDYREYEVRKWKEKLNDKYKTYQTSHSIDAIFSDFEQVIRDCADERSREKIIVGKTPRLVVLGEPGSGKSTLCKFLAFSCQYQQFEKLPSHSGFDWQLVSSEGNFLAPVRIKLSDWENWAIERKDFSLESYLINSLYECVKDIPIKEQWWSLFEKGEILLLLDGLDEIGNNATFKEKVTDTLHRTNHCPTIVTCRTVSFETHQDILSEFPIFSLDGLNKFQQDALIHEYEKDGNLVADELRKQLDSSYEIASLASNPLLLTIICFVVSNSNTNQEVRLPEKKSQLYDKVIDRLLNVWQDRDNPTNELEIEEKKEILAELAYWLWTENEDRQMAFSGKTIKEKIFEILKSKDFQNSRELAHSLLEDFSKLGGILIGESNNNYGFLHLTFYEYLVAFALANREDCLEIALSKTFKSEWEKILVFFGGTLSKTNKTKTNDFFLKLVSLFLDSFATTEKEDEDEEQTDYSEEDFFSPDDSLLRLIYVTIGFGIESEIGEVEQVAMDVWNLLGNTFLIDEYLFEFFEFQKRENNHESTKLFFDYYEKEVKLLRISQSFLIPIIIQIIEDKDNLEPNESRRHAVLMLSVMPIENATLALEKLIQNNNLNYKLREDALWVLTNVFFADAIKVLKRIKSNPEISKWVRDECVKFVLRISKENKPLFLYTDEDERIY